MPSVILPDGTISQIVRGGCELAHELLERRRADRPVALGGGDRVGIGVEGHDLMVRIALDPMDHVAAHLAESHETDLHLQLLDVDSDGG